MAYEPDVPALSGATVAPEGTVAPPSGKRLVTIRLSDGSVHRTYVPSVMTPSEAEASIRQYVLPKIQQAAGEAAEQSTLEKAAIPTPFGTIPSEVGRNVIGFGHGINTLLEGLKQRLGMGGPQQDQQMAADEAQWQKLAQASPSARIASFGGETLPLMAASMAFPALAPEAAAAATATPAASMANAALQGGMMAGVPYVPPGGSLANNISMGMLAGGAMQGPFSILQKLAQPLGASLTGPRADAVADMLKIPGYQPLPSQLTGNPALAGAERVMGYFPFSAGHIEARNAANRAAVSAAGLKALGAPPGTTYGTPEVLRQLKKESGDVFNAFQDSGAMLTPSPNTIDALSQIRQQAMGMNTPPVQLIRTLNDVIGDAGELVPQLSGLPEHAQAQAIRQLGPQAFTSATAPRYPNGMPSDYVQSLLSDLSDWSSQGGSQAALAGKANVALTNDAANSLTPEFGDAYRKTRGWYAALQRADAAFNAGTGELDLGKLSNALSAGNQDVLRYGSRSEPLNTLGDLAAAGRGIPSPPAQGSPTAANLMWQKLGGLLAEGSAAGGAALGLHSAAGGALSPGALAAGAAGGLLPFLLANYGAKAYLSPAAARYMQGGVPWLADALSANAASGGAVVPALAAGLSSSQ